jgi:hypothetical protein
MRMRAVLLALVVSVAAHAAPPAPVPAAGAAAPPPAAVRTGDHPGFGRVVFDLPPGAGWTVERAGERLTVHVSGAEPVVAGRPPRNVRTLGATASTAELTLAPGANVRWWRLGERLVVDVFDPPGTAAAPAAPATGSAPAAATQAASPATPAAKAPAAAAPPAQADRAAPLAAAPPPAPAPAAPEPPALPSPTPAQPGGSDAPVPAAQGPIAVAATPAAAADSVLLPFAATTGAAAFRRGGDAVLVFDERRPIDAGPLSDDPVFHAAEIRLLPAATMLRLPLPADRALRLAHDEAGWTVTAGDAPVLRPIRPSLDGGGSDGGPELRLPAEYLGHSVIVPDPATGGTLLVGTQREPGQGVVVARSTPEFTLLPTWQGVAVAAISDSLVLHEATDGFVLGSALPRGGLALSSVDIDLGALDDAHLLTRRFDFPNLPLLALRRRLEGAMTRSGSVPPGERTPARIAAVQAMLALGLGAEAQSLLSLAATSDPRAADDPDLIGLDGIAALLAGRPKDSAGLQDPRLTGTDEIALWRGLRGAMLRAGAPDAATEIAGGLSLLLAYPEPLRSRLLPLAAETMAAGGETAAAQRLVDMRKDDASLDFARALLAEPRDRRAALAILDGLADSPDRRLRARAAPRAIELHLAGGELTLAAAAGAMERLLYAWRGDAQEAALRMRTAELHAQAGEQRAALAVLREGLGALPQFADTLRARMQQIFAAALTADAATPMPPLDLVALADENVDLLPEGKPGLELATRLADRLTALDLPRRTAQVLEKLVAAAAPGSVRAELGGRLAATRLLLDDAPGALAALDATAADNLPPRVLEARLLAWARATAAEGDTARAAAALGAIETPDTLSLRAQLLEQAKDWKSATEVLHHYVEQTVPAEGSLTEAQAAILLRLASSASQSGDGTTLTDLRTRALPRLPPGRSADMLRLLTEAPVQLPEDLPRARRETALASGLLGSAPR